MTTPLTSTPKFFIGVAGRARHGKTGFAKVLERMFSAAGYIVHLTGFSDPILKEAHAAGLLSVPWDQKPVREKLSPEDLRQLVWLGNKARKKDPNHWVDALDREIRESGADVAIVHGLRFVNELDWVHRNGGTVVKVIRYKTECEWYFDPCRDRYDPTETSVDTIVSDFQIIHYSGQIEWLEEQAKALARFLMRPHPRFSEEPVLSNVPRPYRSPGGYAK